jgi:hypothetical protein
MYRSIEDDGSCPFFFTYDTPQYPTQLEDTCSERECLQHAPVVPTIMAFVSPLALVLLLLALAVSLLYLRRKATPPRSGSDGRERQLPPSPRGLPLLGHLHLLGSLPHRALRSLAAAHGPVLLLRLGRVPAVLVSSAAAAEEVMRTRDLAFASRPRSAMAERLLYGRDVAFAPYGEYWRQARRVCVVHLLSPLRINSFRRVREEEAAALVERVGSAPCGRAAPSSTCASLS